VYSTGCLLVNCESSGYWSQFAFNPRAG